MLNQNIHVLDHREPMKYNTGLFPFSSYVSILFCFALLSLDFFLFGVLRGGKKEPLF